MAVVALSYDPFGRLVLTLPEGDAHVGVIPVRTFPFSDPDRRIAFLNAEGREVHCLDDPATLPPPTRALLEADLARREFLPVIHRIHSVSPGAEPTDWHVETDRGETRFQLSSEDHLRRLGPQGALIADAHGVRYRIPDLRALDAHSQRILRRYL